MSLEKELMEKYPFLVSSIVAVVGHRTWHEIKEHYEEMIEASELIRKRGLNDHFPPSENHYR